MKMDKMLSASGGLFDFPGARWVSSPNPQAHHARRWYRHGPLPPSVLPPANPGMDPLL